MVRREILLLLIAGTAVLGGCAAPPVQAAAGGSLIDVQIVDRTHDEVLPEHRYRGATYVAGRPGNRYAVRLINRTGARVLAVLSVDGINAVSGETAAASQTGYVLAPWESADVTGWRKTDAEAAAFYFTALPDSYAARTDRPRNVGVIGVAVFRERGLLPRPVPFEPTPWSSSSGRDDRGAGREAERNTLDGRGRAEVPVGPAEAPAAAAAPGPQRDAARSAEARSEKLGTGHGQLESSPIARTSFERATSRPAAVVQVFYDSYPNLVASGVIAPRWAVPDPFPGYVPDPPRW